MHHYPRRAKRALGSVENSSCPLLIDSKMAGPIRLKVGGMVEGMQENVLAKNFFFDPFKLTGVRSMCHRCLFYALAMSYRPQIGHAGPWWYVTPVVAAVMTHATGVGHIYLIDKNI